MKYKVIRDSREQQGWDFSPSTSCLGTEVRTIATGDYTIEGYEGVLAIERKGTLGEFSSNIVQKRFENEMVRLEEYTYPFIILEFELSDVINFPVGSGIPKSKWASLKVSKWFILKRIVELQIKYKTKIIFAGKYGKEIAASIFKRVLENAKESRPEDEGTGEIGELIPW